MDWMHLAEETYEWWGYVNTVMQGCTNFPKILEASQNSRRQTGDMKQVPYWGPTNIRCHRTKFSPLFDLAASPVHPCYNESMGTMQGGKFLYDLNGWLGSEDGVCSKELLILVTENRAECINPLPHTLLWYFIAWWGVHFAIDPVSFSPSPPPPLPPPPPPPPAAARGRVREPYPLLPQTASHLINAN
jgi:hypothetical protein